MKINSSPGKTRRSENGFSYIWLIVSLSFLFSISALAIAINAQLYGIELKRIVAIMNDVLKNQISGKTADSGGIGGGNTPLDINKVGSGSDNYSTNTPPLDQAFPGRNEDSSTGISVSLDEIFALPPVVILEAKDGNAALGKAAMAIYNDQTFQKIAAINLPPLNVGYFYAAWLKNPGTDEYYYSGQLEFEATSSAASLFHEEAEDLSRYTTIIISRENQISASPLGDIVLEGSFPENSDLHVNDEDILNFRQSSNLEMEMERLYPGISDGKTSEESDKNLPAKQLTGNKEAGLGDLLINAETSDLSIDELLKQYLEGGQTGAGSLEELLGQNK